MCVFHSNAFNPTHSNMVMNKIIPIVAIVVIIAVVAVISASSGPNLDTIIENRDCDAVRGTHRLGCERCYSRPAIQDNNSPRTMCI